VLRKTWKYDFLFAYQQLTEQIQENNMVRGIFSSWDFQMYFPLQVS